MQLDNIKFQVVANTIISGEESDNGNLHFFLLFYLQCERQNSAKFTIFSMKIQNNNNKKRE